VISSRRFVHGHFSRVPVYRRYPDNIVGVLNAKDLVAIRVDSMPPRIDRLIRKPFFVPVRKTARRIVRRDAA